MLFNSDARGHGSSRTTVGQGFTRFLAGLVLAFAFAACGPADSLAAPGGGGESAGTAGKTKTVLSKSGYDVTPLSKEEVARLAKKLDPEAYRVTQKAGTEPPFCGNLLDDKKASVYACVVCGLPLFSSEHKFDSGTGWPSFFREVDPAHVARKVDSSHGMERVEINCARCGAHLGHVFTDGPAPTGERHCLNSASLRSLEKGAPVPAASRPVKAETAYFAAGCFWGVQHWFSRGPGVLEASSGYMQGRTEKPTYRQVCEGDTGHAETVKVVFDANRITYRRLVEAFFAMHDPTQRNRQGPDVAGRGVPPRVLREERRRLPREEPVVSPGSGATAQRARRLRRMSRQSRSFARSTRRRTVVL